MNNDALLQLEHSIKVQLLSIGLSLRLTKSASSQDVSGLRNSIQQYFEVLGDGTPVPREVAALLFASFGRMLSEGMHTTPDRKEAIDNIAWEYWDYVRQHLEKGTQ